MKKLLLALVAFLIPLTSFAAYPIVWTATSSDASFIAPNTLNNVLQAIKVSGVATSTINKLDVVNLNVSSGATMPAAISVSGFTTGSALFVGPSGTIAQDNTNFFWDDTNNRLGLLTAVPTNTLTLGSTATGIVNYNTVDQTTNYEQSLAQWYGNSYYFGTLKAGSGTRRALRITTGDTLGSGNRTEFIMDRSSNTRALWVPNNQSDNTANLVSFGISTVGGFTQTSGTNVQLAITPTYNQTSGTAANTDILVNRTQTAVGSGNQLLMDLQIGGTSRFVVQAGGNVGIGTTTPVGPLEIVSGANRFSFFNGGSNITPTITVGTSGGKAVGLQAGTAGTSFVFDQTGFFQIGKDTNSNITTGTSNGGTGLFRVGANGGLSLGTSYLATDPGLGSMIISGSMGIGTSTPIKTLEIGRIQSGQSTAAPLTLSLGDTFSNTAGANPKLELFNDGTNLYGLGVSNSQFDAMAPAGARYAWNIAGAEKMRLDTNGNLGIGTTPSYPFDVQKNVVSNIYARLGTTQTLQAADLALGNGTRTWGLRTNGNTTADFQLLDLTQGGTYLTVVGGASGGNVGVGTITPNGRLSLGTGTGAKFLVYDNNSNIFSGLGVDMGEANAVTLFGHGQSGTGFINFGFAGNTTGTIASGFTEKMRITYGGNVGIGTTSPNSTLQIAGTGQTTAALTDAGSKGATLNITDSNVSNPAGSGGALLFSSFASNGVFAQSAIKGLLENGSGNGRGGLAFSTRANTGNIALTEMMRITSQGNVGIGTVSPGNLLHVKGGKIVSEGTSGGWGLAQFVNTNVGEATIVQAAGVTGGIGGTLTSSSNNYIWAFGPGSYSTTPDKFNIGSNGISGNIAINISAPSGYVGIGTTTPNVSLSVNGDIQIEKGAPAYTGNIVCYMNGGKLGHMTQAALLSGAGAASCVAN